jgi:hypothetical protein
LGLWGTGPTPQQAYKLDGVIQAMFDDGIVPVNLGLDAVLLEEEKTLVACFWSLEHKAQALFVGLAFQTVQATALKAHLLGLPETDAISRLVGTGSELLCRIAVDVVSNPSGSGRRRRSMESLFREAILLSQLGEESRSFLLVVFGDAACLLPSGISPHLFEPRDRLPKQRIVETASRFKMGSQVLGLLRIDLQGQFQQERGRLTPLHDLCWSFSWRSRPCSTNHKTSLLKERFCRCAAWRTRSNRSSGK